VDASDVQRHICHTYDSVDVAESQGGMFFTYDPDGDLPQDRWLPFATIVTDDSFDSVSDLSRPDAYRLNLGLTKATYTAMFGAAPTERDEHGVLDTGFDYTAVDRVMPHPMYASQYWVCVVNPATLDRLRPLVAEAYEFAVRKHVNHRARQPRS
jgi:hypothetical protein